ncbi:MAG TPA: right-handed parallel beta-helix repeat-containing protein [Thermoanaerobaculia bacterium]|nr:right-handed parallel beta-helix repeat-containing protein [Thermoanaerobaculia bacterium]
MRNKNLTLLALSALLFAGASRSEAQALRTWVSGIGNDNNPCSRTAPCKTFAGALLKTGPSGEINVLDPGGFGAVTITKAVTILADGATGGIQHSFINGITINAGPNDVVTLKGLTLESSGQGLNGIRFQAGGSLVVEDCIIRNGVQKGITFEPSGHSHLFVRNTTIVNFNHGTNGGAILIKPGAAGSAKVVLDNVRMTRNLYGVRAENRSTVSVRDSVASDNTNNGFLAFSTGSPVDMSIESTLVSLNGINGIRSEGAAAVVRISNNTITGNNPGLATAGGGQIISYGDNNNSGNVGNNNGAPTSTIDRQ